MIVSHHSHPLCFYCCVSSKTGERKWFGSFWLNGENDRWRSRGVLHTPKAVDSTRGEEVRAAQLVRWGENYTPAENRKRLVRIFAWQNSSVWCQNFQLAFSIIPTTDLIQNLQWKITNKNYLGAKTFFLQEWEVSYGHGNRSWGESLICSWTVSGISRQ